MSSVFPSATLVTDLTGRRFPCSAGPLDKAEAAAERMLQSLAEASDNPAAVLAALGINVDAGNQFTATVSGSAALVAGRLARVMPDGTVRPGGPLNAIGVVVVGAAVGQPATVQTSGVATLPGPFTPGTIYYANPTATDGSLTATVPQSSQNGLRVGVALTPGTLEIGFGPRLLADGGASYVAGGGVRTAGAVKSVNGRTGDVAVPPAPGTYVPDLEDLTNTAWRAARTAVELTAQLAAANAAGGGRVVAGPFAFTISNLVVGPSVTLEGVNGGPNSRTGYRDGPSNGNVTDGTRFLITDTVNPGVTVRGNGTLRGVSIVYPNQSPTAGTPTAYPPAIRMRGRNPTVRDVELVNPYIGIDVNNATGTAGGITERATIEHVTGQPLYRGIVLGRANDAGGGIYTGILDIPRIRDVHFNPWWSMDNPFIWQKANGIAFDIVDVDEILMGGCFAYGYSIGLRLDGANRGAYGSLVGGGFDICGVPVQVVTTQAQGFNLSDLGLVPISNGQPGLTVANGNVLATGLRFWNSTAGAAVSGGALSLVNCHWRDAGTHVAQSGGGKAAVTGGMAKGGLTTSGVVVATGVIPF